jgi:hypothetical protein
MPLLHIIPIQHNFEIMIFLAIEKALVSSLATLFWHFFSRKQRKNLMFGRGSRFSPFLVLVGVKKKWEHKFMFFSMLFLQCNQWLIIRSVFKPREKNIYIRIIVIIFYAYIKY